jgi:hypothetical protein
METYEYIGKMNNGQFEEDLMVRLICKLRIIVRYLYRYVVAVIAYHQLKTG